MVVGVVVVIGAALVVGASVVDLVVWTFDGSSGLTPVFTGCMSTRPLVGCVFGCFGTTGSCFVFGCSGITGSGFIP